MSRMLTMSTQWQLNLNPIVLNENCGNCGTCVKDTGLRSQIARIFTVSGKAFFSAV